MRRPIITMYILILVGAATLLGGCGETPVERAERRLKIIQRNGSEVEVCAAKQALAEAYLDGGKESDYSLAKVTADIYCTRVRLNQLGP